MESATVQAQDLLAQVPDEGLDLESLTRLATTVWRENLFAQLTALWRQGKAFVSEVDRRHSEYLPTTDAMWTTSPVEGYFGYHSATGVYQLRRDSRRLGVELLATLDLGSPVSTIAVSTTRNEFAVGLYSGEIALGSIDSASVFKRIPAHVKRVWSLDFSPDEEMLVSGSQDGQIIVWDRFGTRIHVIAELEDWVTCVRFAPDGSRLISGQKIANPLSAAVRVWSVAPPVLIQSFSHQEVGKNVYAVEFLPDGSGFISGGSDKSVACYSFDRPQPVFQSAKHSGTVNSLAIHPNSAWAASGAWTGTIKVWNLEDGEVLRTIEAHNTRVTSIASSRSGRLLASGSRDSYVSVWAMPGGQLLANMRAHEGWVRSVAFGSESSLLLSGGSEGYCKIWELVPFFVPREQPKE